MEAMILHSDNTATDMELKQTGPDKVRGRVRYTADYAPEGMLHAVVVDSGIASGRIASIDEREALTVPGLVAILTHRNAPRVDESKHESSQAKLFLLQDDAVQFDRQPVAGCVMAAPPRSRARARSYVARAEF